MATPIERFNQTFDELDDEGRMRLAEFIDNANVALIASSAVNVRRMEYSKTLSGNKYGPEVFYNLFLEREKDFLEEFGHYHLPEWLLRIECQDQLMEMVYEKLQEEGVID